VAKTGAGEEKEEDDKEKDNGKEDGDKEDAVEEDDKEKDVAEEDRRQEEDDGKEEKEEDDAQVTGWHGRASGSELARGNRPNTRTAHLDATTGDVAIAPSAVPPPSYMNNN
jgi:hypothetical protein